MLVEANLSEREAALVKKLYTNAVEQKFNRYDFVLQRDGTQVDNVYPELIGVDFSRPLEPEIAKSLWHFLHNHLDNFMGDPSWKEISDLDDRIYAALGGDYWKAKRLDG